MANLATVLVYYNGKIILPNRAQLALLTIGDVMRAPPFGKVQRCTTEPRETQRPRLYSSLENAQTWGVCRDPPRVMVLRRSQPQQPRLLLLQNRLHHRPSTPAVRILPY
ncbi:uncharacterized protein LOC144918288 isoform X1 [Branchiostoma floridae x Branchiostoma belcheri]